jgi:hypothetical protein
MFFIRGYKKTPTAGREIGAIGRNLVNRRDVLAYVGFGKGRHKRGDRLQLAVFRDTLNMSQILDIFLEGPQPTTLSDLLNYRKTAPALHEPAYDHVSDQVA